jgi:mannitol/fructose-specific phosphotransferase system IIA component (Ntr-type)
VKLHNLLTEDLIIPDLASRTRDEVLKELVDFLRRKGRIIKAKELYDSLVQRENLGTTAIGEGVAIPHCKLKSLKAPILVLGISRNGAHFESLDGRPSHIFFLVVSSADDPGMNLRILAAIAQLVRKATPLARRILDAEGPAGVIAAVRDEEERLND